MTPFEMNQRVNLLDGQPAPLTRHSPLFTTADDASHVWRVHLHRNNAPVSITGSVEAYFRRADGIMAHASGTSEGSTAIVVLPHAAYAVPGPVTAIMRAAMEGDMGVQTIAKLYFAVQNDLTGEVVDDEIIMPLQDILASMAEMESFAARLENVTAEAGVLPVGEEATVSVTQTEDTTHFSFGIPSGNAGEAATIEIGIVETLAPEETASIVNSGTSSAAVFDFKIPRGAQGAQGAPGTGLTLKGLYPTLADLQAEHPFGEVGDAYVVGDATTNTIYLWDDPTAAWVDIGSISGGDMPFNGIAPGASGYVVHQQNIPSVPGAYVDGHLVMWDDGGLPQDSGIASGAIDAGSLHGKTLEEIIAEAVEASKLATLQAEHPVGDLKVSTNPANPATYLGFGTWVSWGAGRVPVGVDAAQSEFNTVNKTGGEKTHTPTVAELAPHMHAGRIYSTAGSNNAYARAALTVGVDSTIEGWNIGNTTSAGGGTPFNILQPYITCYMWVRTA